MSVLDDSGCRTGPTDNRRIRAEERDEARACHQALRSADAIGERTTAALRQTFPRMPARAATDSSDEVELNSRGHVARPRPLRGPGGD